MPECWKILGIPPTKDKDIINKAWRNLMLKYHPDRVQSPELKRRYTIKCFKINNAREKALEQANSAIFQKIIYSKKDNNYSIKVDLYVNPFVQAVILYILIAPWVIGPLLLIYQKKIWMFIDIILKYPHYYPFMLIPQIIIIFLLAIIIGFWASFITFPAIFFILLFCEGYLIGKLNLLKYKPKIYWLLCVIINIYVFNTDYFHCNIGKIISYTQYGYILSFSWRFFVSATWPLIFFLYWINDIMIFNKIKKKGDIVIFADIK